MPLPHDPSTAAAGVRPVLQALARLIATDRRTVILATAKAEILLSNSAASRLGVTSEAILAAFDWPGLCAGARRAGSIAASARLNGTALEGELVHLPLGPTDAYLLRLAETDHEAALLRNRSRTATLLRVSHDLRTPIQSLLSAADAVFAAPDAETESISARRGRMKRAAELALRHIDNVIKVIRGEMAPGDLLIDEDFNLVEEVRGILDMVEPIAVARGAEIAFAEAPDPDIRVRGPLRFVRALMQNLIDNSVKHGGHRIEIALTCRRRGPPARDVAITVEVADSGGGLPPAQKARLLGGLDAKPTSKTDPPANDETAARPSAGLNVLAHALSQLGGKIEVLDRGADGQPVGGPADPVSGTILKVHFSLPAAETSRETGPRAEATLKGVTILVVEDSPSSRDWLVATLRHAGVSVEAVGSGAKALEILRNANAARNIDLLLTDMTLPQMSGVDLVRQIRKEQASGGILWHGKMLGLTAHVDDRLREACLALGMIRLLEKPIRHSQLRQSIQRALAPEQAAEPADPAGFSRQAGTPEAADAGQRITPPLSGAVVAELIDHMTLSGAKSFMQRALSEAQAALDDIRDHGIRDDTGRMLHAATGASGLTGLTLLERRLRGLELAVEQAGTRLDAECAALETAISTTAGAIEQLH